MTRPFKPSALALIVQDPEHGRIVSKAILRVTPHVAMRISDALGSVAEVQCRPCTHMVDISGKLVYIDTDILNAGE